MHIAPKYLLILFIILSCKIIYAFEGDEKLVPEYIIVKNEKDPSLKKQEAVFEFTFTNIPPAANITAACNGLQKQITTNNQKKYIYKTSPGSYQFQLFYTPEYFEIYMDSIKILPGYKMEIEVNFQSSVYPVIMDKPVIYCYPKEKTNIHVELRLKGDMLFTYPTYNNGWDITVDSSGTIYSNEKSYKYLFWEGETKINYTTTCWNDGSIVDKNELLPFLENSLTQMGMNSQEQQDFITYWYPLMIKNEKNYVHFVFNDEYNDFAEIHIDPKPDNILRVYMLWANAGEVKNVSLTNQPVPVLKREGFTLVEWGGSELRQLPMLAF